jgi:hypothetical protein
MMWKVRLAIRAEMQVPNSVDARNHLGIAGVDVNTQLAGVPTTEAANDGVGHRCLGHGLCHPSPLPVDRPGLRLAGAEPDAATIWRAADGPSRFQEP